MKSFGTLLLYYFTWRSVIIGSAALGLVFVVLAANAMLLSPQTAFALSLCAYLFLFVLPYVSAPWALRKVIGSRGLALVPGLPLAAGSALLFLTLLTAAFLPLSGRLVGVPAVEPLLGLKVFVIASAYAGMLQVALTSKYMSVIFNYVPVLVIVLVSVFSTQLLALWNDTTVVAALAALSLAAWGNALRVLASRRRFKPVYCNAQNDQQHWTAAVSRLLRLDQDAAANPAGSLLLGQSAGIPQRVLNIAYAMVFTPLLSALLVQFTDEDGEGPVMGMRVLLMACLVLTLFTSWMDGEFMPRTRLLWLRTSGSRQELWTTLERELWTGHLVKAAIALALALVAAAISDIPRSLLAHFPLAIFTVALYQSYQVLCARLYRWSSLPQALALIGSLAAIIGAVVYGARFTANILLLLEGGLLLMAMLFREVTRRGFTRVDWALLRKGLSTRAEAVSA